MPEPITLPQPLPECGNYLSAMKAPDCASAQVTSLSLSLPFSTQENNGTLRRDLKDFSSLHIRWKHHRVSPERLLPTSPARFPRGAECWPTGVSATSGHLPSHLGCSWRMVSQRSQVLPQFPSFFPVESLAHFSQRDGNQNLFLNLAAL